MEKKDSLITHEPGWLKDFDISKQEIVQRFAPEQMVKCGECLRANPPTRLNCFYCGAELEINEKNEKLLRPVFRKLENWEKGFNIACFPIVTAEINETETISSFLQLENETVKNVLHSGLVLPLARVQTIEEVRIVVKRLKDFGLRCSILPDEYLAPEKMPRRVRALEFSESLRLSFTGKNEIETIQWNDLQIFIEGSIFESKRESFEQRKRGENANTGESSEFSADDRVLDFYDGINPLGYRISAKSFDFSCLGAKKSLLASANFGILIDELKRRAPRAVFDDNYKTARQLLNHVWTIEERKDSTGVKHAGIGKINLASRLTISNQNQFTRYSRMMAHFASNEA